MTRVLITGATGNVGLAVIQALSKLNHPLDIYAGLRDADNMPSALAPFDMGIRVFNFTDITTYKPALEGCDVLFLLRPPQISEVEKYFKPMIDTCIRCGVKHIVFLSVQVLNRAL